MNEWKETAYREVALGAADPDYVPRFRVPARRWWQFWKPKWELAEGISHNQIRRAYGFPPT